MSLIINPSNCNNPTFWPAPVKVVPGTYAARNSKPLYDELGPDPAAGEIASLCASAPDEPFARRVVDRAEPPTTVVETSFPPVPRAPCFPARSPFKCNCDLRT